MIRLLLFLALTYGAACAQDPTIDHYIAAIAGVETGVRYMGVGDIRGKWSVGQDGEVSPWQLSPAVLADLNVKNKSRRIHSDPVLAESIVRQWLARLHSRYGRWEDVLGAYHRGHGARRGGAAADYADRVINLAHRLASERQ